ncbi:HTH_Tnp_Tc3_2 domain-containing protein [Trichonephila clavipes]|nr:HTH_Tnp_Tc3_2 domain-containing protein [Trichonephila clavipes]
MMALEDADNNGWIVADIRAMMAAVDLRLQQIGIRVSVTSRKRMEDSERWRALGRIEAGQSVTDVAFFFGVLDSVTSRLWKQFQTTQTVVRCP